MFGYKRYQSRAVVYLARHAEGLQPVRSFIESYEKFEAGIDHDLVIIWKGYPGGEIRSRQKLLVDRVRHHSIVISDEGYDLTAYRAAAEQIDYDQVYFLNTFTTILHPGWLGMLAKVLDEPSVGIVGATASWQSLQDSFKVISKAIWLAQNNVPFSNALAREWGHEIIKHAPAWMDRDIVARIKSKLRYSLGVPPPKYKVGLDEAFEKYWSECVQIGGPLEFFGRFQPFPNPHIRSNGFGLQRSLFLDLSSSELSTKEQTFEFESGPNSLTKLVVSRGEKALLVDADGRAWDARDWNLSETFRIGKQKKLLLADNQTRMFDNMNYDQKKVHYEMTWGRKGSGWVDLPAPQGRRS